MCRCACFIKTQIWRNIALHHLLNNYSWIRWMGAVRMRVQTADKNITIIHKSSTPVNQLTSCDVKSCMFVRHPFTAEDPLVSKWCNVTFLFWWISWYPENLIFYINYCFNVIIYIYLKKNIDIISNIWSWMFLLRTSFQLWKFTEFECRWQCDTEVSSLCSYSYVSAFRSTFLCHTCCIAPTVLIIFMHWSLYTSWRASDWRTTPIIIPIQVSAFLALFDSMFFSKSGP